MTNKITLAEILSEVGRFRDDREWDQFHNPKDLAISLNLEASEVLEHFLWLNNDELAAYLKENKEDIGDELADVLYNLLLLTDKLEIDLASAFKRKMLKNAKKYPIEKSKGSHKKYTQL